MDQSNERISLALQIDLTVGIDDSNALQKHALKEAHELAAPETPDPDDLADITSSTLAALQFAINPAAMADALPGVRFVGAISRSEDLNGDVPISDRFSD